VILRQARDAGKRLQRQVGLLDLLGSASGASVRDVAACVVRVRDAGLQLVGAGVRSITPDRPGW
jgi:hypothetical protein